MLFWCLLVFKQSKSTLRLRQIMQPSHEVGRTDGRADGGQGALGPTPGLGHPRAGADSSAPPSGSLLGGGGGGVHLLSPRAPAAPPHVPPASQLRRSRFLKPLDGTGGKLRRGARVRRRLDFSFSEPSGIPPGQLLWCPDLSVSWPRPLRPLAEPRVRGRHVGAVASLQPVSGTGTRPARMRSRGARAQAPRTGSWQDCAGTEDCFLGSD